MDCFLAVFASVINNEVLFPFLSESSWTLIYWTIGKHFLLFLFELCCHIVNCITNVYAQRKNILEPWSHNDRSPKACRTSPTENTATTWGAESRLSTWAFDPSLYIWWETFILNHPTNEVILVRLLGTQQIPQHVWRYSMQVGKVTEKGHLVWAWNWQGLCRHDENQERVK